MSYSWRNVSNFCASIDELLQRSHGFRSRFEILELDLFPAYFIGSDHHGMASARCGRCLERFSHSGLLVRKVGGFAGTPQLRDHPQDLGAAGLVDGDDHDVDAGGPLRSEFSIL